MTTQKPTTTTPLFIAKFFRLESAGGILLMFAAFLAIIFANSPLSDFYQNLFQLEVEYRIGTFSIEKSLLLWINDGLMAIFFFLIGLELKRELIEGELSETRNIILPGMGALGGMIVPALVYVAFNFGDEIAMRGWAISAATDIAFALGILSLLGSRVPVTVKVFLTSLAIFDDIGAILIIAIFYTENISFTALSIALACLPILYLFNRKNILSKSPYILIGTIMWVATLKSGIHATIAGVTLAMFIPMYSKQDPHISPLKGLEHDLHSIVAFFVLPVFAFANAGLDLRGVGLEQLLHGVSMGTAMGLFIGKQLGIFSFCFLTVKMGWVTLPNGINWKILYGTAAMCGIGFTMSLFIGSLAFKGLDVAFDERLGIIVGSLLSGTVGYFMLSRFLPRIQPVVRDHN